MEKETVTLIGGMVLENVHPAATCLAPCPIHTPSDHHMVTWPQEFWGSAIEPSQMMRVCEHDYPHPDPDDVNRRLGYTGSIHTCDGCCLP
jgi:hypothetical protein